MSFAAEPYGVFVDDLVSSLTGGVTRERFVFLDEQKPFQLAYAAAAVASTVRVSGIVNGDYFRFTAGTDFDVVAGTIVWRESAPDVPAARATWPDRGSDFYASYERTPDPQAPPRLTDRNPGSIVRTLGESFAREYAVISRQLDLVYQAGFLSTASGRDLDQVVSLVGHRAVDAQRRVGPGRLRALDAGAGRHLHPGGDARLDRAAAADHRRDDGRADAPLGDALRDRAGARPRLRPGGRRGSGDADGDQPPDPRRRLRHEPTGARVRRRGRDGRGAARARGPRARGGRRRDDGRDPRRAHVGRGDPRAGRPHRRGPGRVAGAAEDLDREPARRRAGRARRVADRAAAAGGDPRPPQPRRAGGLVARADLRHPGRGPGAAAGGPGEHRPGVVRLRASPPRSRPRRRR